MDDLINAVQEHAGGQPYVFTIKHFPNETDERYGVEVKIGFGGKQSYYGASDTYPSAIIKMLKQIKKEQSKTNNYEL